MQTKWQPKRSKFKRLHKGVIKKCQYRLSTKFVQQGYAGLRVLKSGRFTPKQLEQSRRKLLVVKKKKEKQRIWFKCVPDVPITCKALGLRMGKGKGAINYWSARLLAGKIMVQINHMTRRRSFKALSLIRKILPVPTKVVPNRLLIYTKVKTH